MKLKKMLNQKVKWIFPVILSIVAILLMHNTLTGDWSMTYADVDRMMQTVDHWLTASYQWGA